MTTYITLTHTHTHTHPPTHTRKAYINTVRDYSSKVPIYQINREGNGTPFRYPCLETPMDGGAW